MYPPKQHQETNFENIIRTIKEFPLATLISVSDGIPFISHLPLLYKKEGRFGVLIGHIDKNNNHAKLLDNSDVHVVFHGPEAYISPTIYHTKQLPTWNYIKVHIEGKVRLIENKETLINDLINMNDFLETGDERFVLERTNEKMEKFVNYISGFEIEIKHWEGKFKLSQDKLKKDQNSAKIALLENSAAKLKYYIDAISDS
jgi:transcriptional regulator